MASSVSAPTEKQESCRPPEAAWRSPRAIAILVLVAGMGMMQGMAASNTVIQTIVTDDKRGRVMSYYTMAFMGMAPFGSLLAGTMASATGAPWTVIMNGSVVLLGAVWFATRLPALRLQIRPIYREMGIIQEEEGIPQ